MGRREQPGVRILSPCNKRIAGIVDARTLTGHYLTMDALAAGRPCVSIPGSEIEDSMTFWYLRSAGDQDTHHGHLRHGRVLAACCVEFSPLRTWRDRGSALSGEPPDPDQTYPKCYRRSGLKTPGPGPWWLSPLAPRAAPTRPGRGSSFKKAHDHGPWENDDVRAVPVA